MSSPVVQALLTAGVEVAEAVRAATVEVHSPYGTGSGTAWRPDGLIVTNSHVVPADVAEVVTMEGRRIAARVVARNEEHDLAALRVADGVLGSLPVGDSASVRPGQLAVAAGNPLGRRGTVTAGVVIAAGTAAGLGTPFGEAIRADLRLAPGSSGGPLANARGEVIGINAMIVDNMAVAIPSAAVVRFLAEKQLPPGRLGVELRPAAVAGHPGLLVTHVQGGSAAERAGLLPGDFLIGVDGRGGRGLVTGLRGLRAGLPARLDLRRGGLPWALDVVPDAAAA